MLGTRPRTRLELLVFEIRLKPQDRGISHLRVVRGCLARVSGGSASLRGGPCRGIPVGMVPDDG
jgi:hypothetical protein